MSNIDVDRNEYESAADVLATLRAFRIIGHAIKARGDSMRQKFNRQICAEIQQMYIDAAEREGKTQAEVNADLAAIETEVQQLSHKSNSRN